MSPGMRRPFFRRFGGGRQRRLPVVTNPICGPNSMNKQHRVLWDAAHARHVVAPEFIASQGKPGSTQTRIAPSALALACALSVAVASAGVSAAPVTATTLPTGGQVVAGQAAVSQSGATMTVRQGSQNAAINWQSFSVGSGASVHFQQPNASSVALNRVLGSDVSVIQGTISANGHVFLVNPNGVLFTPTAQVNVGGLVAATQGISTEDFMAGRYRFAGQSTASVNNQGSIQGSTVAFVAAKIINTGTITATAGQVLMGAGNTVTLDLGGPVKLQVEQGALDALIEQGGAIRADGGMVYLSAKAAGDLSTSVINHTGVTQANSLQAGAGGSLLLQADTVQLAGSLQAQGTSQGGSIRAQASKALTVAAELRADSTQGQGGDISLSAPTVRLQAATLQADGAKGGGRIRVGGGWQGKDGDLANASLTEVDAKSRLSANATSTGNGGTVVLWSDKATRLMGTIEAKGGAQAGDGGKVEVSSKGKLVFDGDVRAGAAHGKNGMLLLDPKNLNIEFTESFDKSVPDVWYADVGNDTATDSRIDSEVLKSTLAKGTSITLQATNDLKVNSNVELDDAPLQGGNLTLNAGRSILINANIRTNNGNLTLVANDTDTTITDRDKGVATIAMAKGTVIDTGTGTLDVQMKSGLDFRKLEYGDITLATVKANVMTLSSAAFIAVVDVQDKVYDGTKSATVKSQSVKGLAFTVDSNIKLDAVTATYSRADARENAIFGTTDFTVSGFSGVTTSALKTHSGASIREAEGSGVILQREITISLDPSKVVSKSYDGSTTATVSNTHFKVDNLVAGQSLVLTPGSASYETADVGKNKTVTVELRRQNVAAGDGTSLKNYKLVYANGNIDGVGIVKGQVGEIIGKSVTPVTPPPSTTATTQNVAVDSRVPTLNAPGTGLQLVFLRSSAAAPTASGAGTADVQALAPEDEAYRLNGTLTVKPFGSGSAQEAQEVVAPTELDPVLLAQIYADQDRSLNKIYVVDGGVRAKVPTLSQIAQVTP